MAAEAPSKEPTADEWKRRALTAEALLLAAEAELEKLRVVTTPAAALLGTDDWLDSYFPSPKKPVPLHELHCSVVLDAARKGALSAKQLEHMKQLAVRYAPKTRVLIPSVTDSKKLEVWADALLSGKELSFDDHLAMMDLITVWWDNARNAVGDELNLLVRGVGPQSVHIAADEMALSVLEMLPPEWSKLAGPTPTNNSLLATHALLRFKTVFALGF